MKNININKYSRQIVLPFVGIDGQKKIGEKKVILVGAGALAHSISIYIAASGIGTIKIYDDDTVEESNLSRQIFFRAQDIGRKKAETLAKYLKELHPDIEIKFQNIKFSEKIDLNDPFKYHYIINASDNFWTRYTINRISLKMNIPWFDAGISTIYGHLGVFEPGRGCFECLFPDKKDSNDNCSLEGVLSPICGIMGSFVANEVLKKILGVNCSPINHFLKFDFLKNDFKKYYWIKNSDCQICKQYSFQKNQIKKNNDEFFMTNLDFGALSFMNDYIIINLEKKLIPILNSKKAKFITEEFDKILKTHLNDSLYLKYKNKIIFICINGRKSKILCEAFREKNIESFYSKYPA